jgi:hypothetical protein
VGHKADHLGRDIWAAKRKKGRKEKKKNGEVEGWADWGIWPKRVLENSKDFSISYVDSNLNTI